MAEEKEKKDEVAEVKLVEVPTQTTLAYQLPDGKVIAKEQLLAQMANDIEKIKKAIV